MEGKPVVEKRRNGKGQRKPRKSESASQLKLGAIKLRWWGLPKETILWGSGAEGK